jgi:hypothetical protein
MYMLEGGQQQTAGLTGSGEGTPFLFRGLFYDAVISYAL